jgi:hypothetical protein
MILDTGTLVGIMISLGGSITLMFLFIRENLYLKRTIQYLLEKEDDNG